MKKNKQIEVLPPEYEIIDLSASKIAREMLGIDKFDVKRYIKHPSNDEIYMVGFGKGAKTEPKPKGQYAFWVWYYKDTPRGASLNCELKDKFDSIDYYWACIQNAEETITHILNEEKAA